MTLRREGPCKRVAENSVAGSVAGIVVGPDIAMKPNHNPAMRTESLERERKTCD
jgi:hypothetical protein